MSLATLSSHLIANHYRHTKKLPEDDDLQAITSSMQAVSSFTDNFILDQDTTDRLKAMGSQMKDPAAAQIQTLRAFLPVILAIGSFSFSKTESQFIQEVSTKITAKCDSVMDMVFAGLSDDEKKLAKIHVLGMLCDIYAGCHNAEVKRLTKLDGEAKAVITTQASIDEILKNFDQRVAVVHTLADSILPRSAGMGSSSAAGGGIAPTAAHPPQEAPVPPAIQEQPAAVPSPAPETPPALQAEPPPAPLEQTPQPEETSAPPAENANPMSFFSAKEPDDATPPPPAPPPAPESPPAEQAPPAAPPPVQPPPTETPPPPPAEENKDESGDGNANPMSFFASKNSDDNSS